MAAIVLGFFSGSAAAWETRGAEAFTQNQSRNSALVLQCVRPGMIWLRIVQPKGWTANVAVAVRIGDRVLPMKIDGGSDYVVLGNAANGGVTSEVLALLKSSTTLVLEGPAAQKMAPASKTFSLAGAESHIARLEQRCRA